MGVSYGILFRRFPFPFQSIYETVLFGVLSLLFIYYNIARDLKRAREYRATAYRLTGGMLTGPSPVKFTLAY